MKKILGFLLVLGVSVFSNCTKIGNEDGPQKSKLLENREWLKNDMFSKIISAYANDKDFNMGKLEKLLKTQYNVDLWDEMNKLGLEVPAVITPAARAAGINVDVTVFYERSNITEKSKLYPYLVELTNSVTEETTPEMLKSALTNIESRLEMDISIPMNEKENFCASLLLITTNLSSIEQVFAEQAIGGRVAGWGWFRKAWRIVRSVVVTTVVSAVAGTAVNFPIGTIVGGALGFIGSVADAAANDYCHGAFQCPGFRQNCTTGACAPQS